MTEPKDKNEAQRLDEILARAAKTILAACQDGDADYLKILAADGLITDYDYFNYRLTPTGHVAAQKGHGYTALFEANQREERRKRVEGWHRWANTIIAVAAFGLSLFLTFCR